MDVSTSYSTKLAVSCQLTTSSHDAEKTPPSEPCLSQSLVRGLTGPPTSSVVARLPTQRCSTILAGLQVALRMGGGGGRCRSRPSGCPTRWQEARIDDAGRPCGLSFSLPGARFIAGCGPPTVQSSCRSGSRVWWTAPTL